MGAMRRLLLLLVLTLLAALAANVRLYLKDGGYHVVREYEVQGDRVRFYSVERSDWEEIPLSLVDLVKTKAEADERQAALEKEASILTAEDEAERAQREEVGRVPVEPGVYLIEGKALKPIKQAEAKAVTSKGRSILRAISPVPIVAGKATVELEGETSGMTIYDAQPEFYFRLALRERFALFKLNTRKGVRVVQTWQIMPVTNEVIEEQEVVPTLNRQLDDNLYKIWPADPLKPGEYAMVEYSAGERNIQIWDFTLRPPAR
ncbi:MAG TPA: hypothetical protein VLH09_09460 [Bryobacteraceae bacterium]|nr:hypothetical protein [Bryobacteraceae bacterium]